MRTRKRICNMSRMVLWGFVISVIFLMATIPPSPACAEDKDADSKTLREKRYYYKAFNRRDPFRSLVTGEFEESEYELVNIYGVKLVGVLSGGLERFAMLEDNNGYGYILKAGDPVRNGSIVSVGDRSVIARIAMFGQTTTVTLRLEDKNEKGE